MRWEDLRNTAPQQWVIIEAVDAHTEGNNRIIENIQLVEVFGKDNIGALRRYAQLHKSHPEKEFYVFHTSRPELNVKERKWTGIRGIIMKIYFVYGLPFTEICFVNGENSVTLYKVLVGEM